MYELDANAQDPNNPNISVYVPNASQLELFKANTNSKATVLKKLALWTKE